MSSQAKSISEKRLVEALGAQADRAGRFVMTFPAELTLTMRGSPIGSSAELGTLWMFWNSMHLRPALSSPQREHIENGCVIYLAQMFFCPVMEVRKAWESYRAAWDTAEKEGTPPATVLASVLVDRLGLSGNPLAEDVFQKHLKNSLFLGWPLREILSGTIVVS